MSELRTIAQTVCAALFSGGSIEHARAHRISTPFSVEKHVHGDLFQFDWMVNCRGTVSIDDVTTRLDGCSLVLVAPQRPHAMTLEPAGDTSVVYHVRVAIEAAPQRALKAASQVHTSLTANAAIEAALTDVWRLTVGAAARPLLRMARLAEAIALWPGAGDELAASTKRATTGLDRDLDAALKLMERRLLNPPTLDELADAATLSARQFTRRFRDALGLSPIEFFDRKRLALAQQMLAYEAGSVSEVAQRMGFSSPAVFSRWFGHLAGETPSEYRAKPHAL
jgi:AraC-like DNA-binding protein